MMDEKNNTMKLGDSKEIYLDCITKLRNKGIDVRILTPEITEMAAAMYCRGQKDAYEDVLKKMKTMNISGGL